MCIRDRYKDTLQIDKDTYGIYVTMRPMYVVRISSELCFFFFFPPMYKVLIRSIRLALHTIFNSLRGNIFILSSPTEKIGGKRDKRPTAVEYIPV